MAEREVDWDRYLETFHTERAGAIEAVLSRALGGQHNPYRWLARAVSAQASTVLDLASGSGPVARELSRPGRLVIGLDRSAAELTLAAGRGAGPLLQADGRRLPVRDASIDVVTSCLGLVVLRPMVEVIGEVSRVLRPGGVLAAIAPALRPLAPRDLPLLTRLNARLHTKPSFPGPVELTGFAKTLRRYGLRVVEDARERYRFPVGGRADAELLMSGLYLPSTAPDRVASAVDFLTAVAERRSGVDVAIPMRRIVAIK